MKKVDNLKITVSISQNYMTVYGGGETTIFRAKVHLFCLECAVLDPRICHRAPCLPHERRDRTAVGWVRVNTNKTRD